MRYSGLSVLLLWLFIGCSSEGPDSSSEIPSAPEYQVSIVDGFEHRLYPSCQDASNQTHSKVISTLDTNFYSVRLEICKTDTFTVLGNEVIFKWKNKEWAQPSNDRKGFEQEYPEGTFFTWWGCIDSMIVNGKAQCNNVRSSAMPTYQNVFLSLNKEELICCGDSSLVISIDASISAHFSGMRNKF